MPAATNKGDLLAVTEKEFAKLGKVLDGFDEEAALAEDDVGWSVRDVIVHRAHWIDLFLGWYRDGVAGKEVAYLAPGYKWNQLKAYNADLRARNADVAWDTARARLEAGHAALVAQIEGLDQAALYGGPMPGAKNDWTTGRWAEAAGPSHYRSAAKFARAQLRKTGGMLRRG